MGSDQLAAGQTVAAAEARAQSFNQCRDHVLSRIRGAKPGEHPFRHLFVEQIFPADFYAAVRRQLLECKYGDELQERTQDNGAFLNRRYNIFDSHDDIAECIKHVFSDSAVKQAILEKFYIDPSAGLADSLTIHREFEYFFTKAGRFQNIHIDIPPKLVSFVFYIPENRLPESEEQLNATILYDKSLGPHYPARFTENSVCIFAPHYYSYHGFAATMDRDVLVMFYVNPDELRRWKAARSQRPEAPPFSDLLDAVERKLRLFPLIEYGVDEHRRLSERGACLVNAPHGRVLREDDLPGGPAGPAPA